MKVNGLPGRSHCVLGADWSTARARGVLFGDSHAHHYAPLLHEAAAEIGVSLVLYGNCYPLLAEDGPKRHFTALPTYSGFCALERRRVIDFVRGGNGTRLIVVAASWPFYLGDLYLDPKEPRSRQRGLELTRLGFDKLLREVEAAGAGAVVLGDVGISNAGPRMSCLLGGQGLLRLPCEDPSMKVSRSNSLAMHGDANALLRDVRARWPAVSVVMPQDAMCTEGECMTFLDGEFLYRDTGHIRRNLSVATRRKLADLIGLRQALESALAAATPAPSRASAVAP